MGIILNSGQRELVDELKTWYLKRTKPYFSYSGAAGTGKTTVFHSFLDEVGLKPHQVASAAYVGKAVLVLLRHGLNATTIHALAYMPIFESYEDFDSREDSNGNIIRRTKMKFVLREALDPSIKLIYIDEASMANDKIHADLLSFGVPIVYSGDNNQLPPIFGKSSVMDHPDYTLTEIMRQALDSPIVYMAQCILNDKPINFGTYGDSRVLRSMPIGRHMLTDYDIIICGKNKTREQINDAIRYEVLNRKSHDPVIGDKVINRQNDWDYCINDIYLTNGTIGYITNIDYSTLYNNYITIDFRPDFMDEEFINLRLDYKYFNTDISKRNEFGISKYNKFEYGWCITGHLSQGSEYPRVLFIDQPFKDAEMTKRLRYTAITRAQFSIDFIRNAWW